MPDLTPIRVRGKRGAVAAEKWHAGKKRKVLRNASPACSIQSSQASSRETDQETSRKRKRKLHDPSLSRLEQLPTEILQEIFAYEPNPNLPAASTKLLSQLASHHVYMSVTSRILGRILGFEHGRASNEDLAAATRLLGSHFMTWEFFTTWLKEQSNAPTPVPSDAGSGPRDGHHLIWVGLKPSRGLMPPKKLLIGPWTPEKCKFLYIVRIGMPDIMESNPIYGEIAQEGLAQAIAERMPDVVLTMITMNLRSSTELLRQAVIDAGCNHDIVEMLIHNCMTHQNIDWREAEASSGEVIKRSTIPSDIDFFDASLWAWADKARARGDEDGEWLMDLLRSRGRAVGGLAPALPSTQSMEEARDDTISQ